MCGEVDDADDSGERVGVMNAPGGLHVSIGETGLVI